MKRAVCNIEFVVDWFKKLRGLFFREMVEEMSLFFSATPDAERYPLCVTVMGALELRFVFLSPLAN